MRGRTAQWWSHWLQPLRNALYFDGHSGQSGGGIDGVEPSRVVTLGAPTIPARFDAYPLSSSAPGSLSPLVAADGTTGAYVIRAASRVGRMHASTGQSREDDFAVAATPGGGAVVAVADGVGDPRARHSATGAHIAVNQACRSLQARGPYSTQNDATDVVTEISNAILPAAERLLGQKVRASELATTLTAVACAADGTYWGFTIGDSGIMFLAQNGWETVLSTESALLNDVGGTLPHGAPPVIVTSGRLNPGEALLLATDGLLVPMAAPEVRSFLAARWQQPPDLIDFITDLSFERRGEADDRAAICLWYLPPIA